MKLRVHPLKFPLRLAWQCITHLCSCFYGRFPIGFLEAIQNAKWRWITLILSHHQMLWVCQEIFKQICLIWGPRWNFGNQIAACLQQLRWLQVGSWLGPCFIRRCSPSITIAGNHSELRAYLGGLEPWNFIFHFIKRENPSHWPPCRIVLLKPTCFRVATSGNASCGQNMGPQNPTIDYRLPHSRGIVVVELRKHPFFSLFYPRLGCLRSGSWAPLVHVMRVPWYPRKVFGKF